MCRDIDPQGLGLGSKPKEKKEEVEMNRPPKNTGLNAASVFLIIGIVALHVFLMACICFGVKKTCWVCRKARKGLKQVI